MSTLPIESLRAELVTHKAELVARLERITANLQRGFDANSKEMAKQLEDSEVIDALGNEARAEIEKIGAQLQRMDAGSFGICTSCRETIDVERMKAYPYADECIECAEIGERRNTRI